MSNLDYGFWEIAIEKYGRLKLPTFLLKSLPETEREKFWVTHGFGPHIMLWTETAYREQMEFLNSLNRNIIENKKFRNAFLRNTAVVECDNQDRLVIPKPLMEHYKIEKEVVLLLDNGKIEIWNASEYHAQFDMLPEELNLLNEKIHSTHQHPPFETF
ncbi:MAG: division/cell wall cluster transcriptional repressor MraZ [Bacteroidales bacterium]|jgi:MraZ protein|nr:division/cell wall cluster transcriptional repressor MraZ [Bacteroidales bacterium]